MSLATVRTLLRRILSGAPLLRGGAERARHDEVELQHRRVIESMHDVLYETDAEHRWTFLNPAWEKLTGSPIVESLGRSFLDFVHPDDHEGCRRAYASLVEGAESCRHETRYRTGNGEHRWVEVDARLIRDGAGRVLGTAGRLVDVTARREAEERLRDVAGELERRVEERTEELRRSEEKFRALIERSFDFVVIVNLDGTMAYCSAAVTRIVGWDPGEVLGRHFGEFVYPDDRERAAATFACVLADGGSPASLEVRIQAKGGGFRTLEFTVRNLCSEPAITGIVANGRDVTERNEALERLRESERDYHGLFVNAQDPILILDPASEVVLDANPRACEVYGLATEQLVGKSLLPISRDPHRGTRMMDAALESNAPLRFETVQLRADGEEIHLEVVASVIEYRGGTAILSINRDITERKRTESELERSLSLVQATLDSTADGILVTDCAGRMLSWNRQFVEMWDLDRSVLAWASDERAIATVLELLEDPEAFVAGVRALYADLAAEGFDVLRLRDGRVFERLSKPQRLGEQVVGRVWSFRDVTERSRSQEALQASEERFRQIAENTRDVFYILDAATGEVLYLSPAYEEVWGRSREELASNPNGWLESIHPEDRGRVWSREDMDGARESSYRLVRPGGEVRWIRSRGYPVRNEAGRVYRIAGFAEDITESVRADEALRASEERFRQIAENIREVFFVHDAATGELLYLSPAFDEIWGFPRSQLNGRPEAWIEAIHPDDRAALAEVMQSHVPSYETEYRVVRPDGELRWIRSRGFPVHDERGRVYRMAGLARDVTDHKRAEEALRTSEERFRQIAENVREVFYILDIDSFNLIYVSPAYEEIWGRKVGEVLANPVAWFDSVHPEDAPRLMESMSSPGQGFSVEYRVVRPDGEVRWIWGRGFPVRDGNGRVYREVGISEDITARKLAEDALRGAEAVAQGTAERMRAVATAAAAVIGAPSHATLRDVLQDACRRVVPFDAFFLAAYDAESHEFYDIGGTDSGVPVPPSRIPADGTPAGRVLESRRSLITHDGADPRVRDAILTGTGRRSESAIRTPILAGERPLGIISIQSYTPGLYTAEDVEVVEALAALAATALENLRLAEEQREAEEALRDSQTQLLQAQKMEAVGRLAGGIAHDFNNMLMAIGGHAELLHTDGAFPEAYRWQAEEISRAVNRAAELTRQLLAFSRKQVMQPRSISVNAVVADLESMLRRLIGEDVCLRTSLSPTLGVVSADPGQLGQVLMNLAVNARDAMPLGGTLTIETANVELAGEYTTTHSEMEPGRYVMLAVSDTGEGMDEATRQRIFEPFFTTKPQGKGTGLGLSTVYGIVRQSGGHVWVYSEPGHGTAFKIYLPREDAPAEEPSPEVPSRARVGGTETILLVEDEDVVRALLRMFLERQGYTVLDAPGGDEALRLAEGHGSVDLLLTDVIMPGMSGRELAQHVRERWTGARVIYMSGYTDDAIVHHGVLDPGSEFVQKPVSPDTLSHRIRAVLDAAG
jgi:PAS domain S-box-containing protein